MNVTLSARAYKAGLLAVLAVGLTLGVPGIRWLSQKKFLQYQNELLADATALARTVNGERVKQLTFTPEDAASPVYKRLCSQLQSYVPATRFCAVYFVAQRGDRYVFGPSGITDKMAQAVTPGMVYQRPPAELSKVFASRVAQHAGPYKDERGTFVGALIPFADAQTGEVQLVVVALVDGASWAKGFMRLWVGPVLFALLLVGVCFVGISLLRWYSQFPRLRHGIFRQGEMILTAVVGLVFTASVAWMAHDSEKHSRLSNFVSFSRAQAGEVISAMQGLRSRLSSLSHLLGGEPRVTQEAFRRYVGAQPLKGLAEAWLWIPTTQPSGLKELERLVRQEGYPGFSVWDRDKLGERSALRKRDLYCPILYCEPQGWGDAWLGYDVTEHPLIRPALEGAASSGLVCSSEVLHFGGDGSEQPCLLVFEPVYGRGLRDQTLRGFIVAAVRPEHILRQAFVAAEDAAATDLMAELYELNAWRDPQFLAASLILQQPRFSRQPPLSAGGDTRLRATIPLFIFGRTYVVVVQAGSAYYQAHGFWLGGMAAVSGSLLTAFLTAFVGLLSRRRAGLEKQIQARTLEFERVSQQITTILDSAADGILSLDTAGIHTVVNTSAAQLLGYEISELLGKPSEALWNRASQDGQPGPGDACPVHTTYKYGIEHRKSDARFWRKDGSSFRAAFVSKPLYQQGALVGAVVTFRDITEQKMTEESLQKAYHDLERVNAALQEASQVKTQFLAHMSHEIRTPLNCMIGMTGLLLNTRLDEEQHEYAETIRVSGENLLTVVNEILDYSKIEAQKMELEKQPFELRHCIEDAIDLVAASAAAKKLELTYLIDEKLHTWWIGDATRIRQIIVNLLSNAVKFTDEGEVDLSVTGRPLEGGCYLLTFCIRDTGVGIPPERADRLFHSFSQVDVSTTRRFGGTGLGLAICKRLCELMGGSITAESTGVPGQGTTFRFCIRLEPDYSLHAEIERVVTSIALAGKKILLAEKNTSTRETLLRQLEALGVPAVAVDTAAEALRRLSAVDLFNVAEGFDAAVIDSQLTAENGQPLSLEIRKLPGRERLPIILLSPLGVHPGAEVAATCIAHVTKPVKLSLLYEAIVRAVSLRPATRKIATAQRGLYDSEMGKRHPLRILLAEDNVVNQKVATSILSKIGYRADVVSNGLEALEAVKRTPYDVVLMDVQMPEMDGEQATLRIRQELDAARQPWIVAMTANAMSGDRERYEAAGMNDYVPKPIRVERLVEILRAVRPAGPRANP